ncbi:MAG: thiamine diphosphokinase [Bacteroidaceae bacterium]|nr:thiamine diphosphokinase [Bacteroidaceae bacterium]
METTYDAVILAAGDYPTHPIALEVLRNTPYLICCDGATQDLIDHGIMPHAIVGDGDSLSDSMKEKYASIIHTIEEQEYNDLTKATRFAVAQGFQQIAYLGCTGHREDHTLGNIALLAFYLRAFHIHPVMYTDHGFFTPAIGTHTFPSFPRQQVSIFRLSGTTLTSEGLRWNAYPYAELWQGTLNEANAQHFTIHSDGEYIIYQTYTAK